MMKLEINPKYNMLASFVRTIPEQFDDLGLVIYEGRNILRKCVVGDLHLVIKSFAPPHPISGINQNSLKLRVN